jgi:hypothetical protein
MFKLAKDSAVKVRTEAINQLKDVLVIADPALRERLSSLGNRELFRTCARLSLRDEDAVAQATHITLSLLVQRIEQLTGQIDELNERLTRLVERHAPQLLVPVGIGPDSAVTLLITMGRQPRAAEHRGVFRRSVRSQPHRVLLRPSDLAPAQPRDAGETTKPCPGFEHVAPTPVCSLAYGWPL